MYAVTTHIRQQQPNQGIEVVPHFDPPQLKESLQCVSALTSLLSPQPIHHGTK